VLTPLRRGVEKSLDPKRLSLRPEGPKREVSIAQRGGVLGKGCSPPLSARGMGKRCKLSQWGAGRSSGDLAI